MIKILRSNKNVILKALVIILELLAIGLILYIILLPIWPVLEYKFILKNNNATTVEEKTQAIINHLPKSQYSLSANRLIIAKIGVNAPIVEAADSEQGLAKGAWRIPESSTPDKGGNTVISGHRFKYLPPNNLTFFLFDKLVVGDLLTVVWQDKNYYYKIKEIKIVKPSEISILNPTAESILTLYTCDPIYSQKNRLVVIGELVKE